MFGFGYGLAAIKISNANSPHKSSPSESLMILWQVICRLLFRFLEQLHQLIFPQRRDRVATVATCFVAHRNHDRTPLRDALYLLFKNGELGWINQIIGGIDRQQWGVDFFKIRSRI